MNFDTSPRVPLFAVPHVYRSGNASATAKRTFKVDSVPPTAMPLTHIDRDLELDFIREFAVGGELLKCSSDDRRQRIRVAIYRSNLLHEPFRDSVMDYGLAYQRCYGRPMEMRRTVRHGPKSEPLIAAEPLQK
jgi:hypothetical protein